MYYALGKGFYYQLSIKENKNLDALEESDDEDEFEDIRPEKYVHLNRIYNMLCVYNRKFARWQPLKIEENKQITKHKINNPRGDNFWEDLRVNFKKISGIVSPKMQGTCPGPFPGESLGYRRGACGHKAA